MRFAVLRSDEAMDEILVHEDALKETLEDGANIRAFFKGSPTDAVLVGHVEIVDNNNLLRSCTYSKE